ncbi:MAG: LysR family transcriptional regulator [Curvibacter lanceolatus]|jgi:DNA-binding transcriptional LysR family regulator|uniref:LysR family transcriptional regulator n=1 Tax=Curvibacter lanceolatus TaxID=86182 RepID=UPI00037C8C7C|nr:LysR family transcriptional regulator [Curvibacter lanceolatus]MBV5291169.1 LysR family transcriptional regulator [Curvibacter lanceolatus]
MAFSADNVDLFLSVLDRGSFSAAARALGRVPSAVSMAVAQLEAELDLVLFDRSGREPRPTAAARALEPQARLLAVQLRQLNSQARSLNQGLEERLTLAIAPELLAGPWSGPLAALAAEHPLLQVELLAAPQADALKLLHEGRAQLALVFERPSLDGREGFQEVGSETLVAVMAPGHPMLAHPPAPGEPAQTFRENLLTEVRQIVVAGRDLGQSDPRFVFARHHWRTDNQVVALRLIEAGLGWGWLPQSFVRSQVAAGSLVVLPFENLTNGLALWVDVVWSKERPLGLGARRFIELIQDVRGER